MSLSWCHLNVTYYTRQHSFESEPKTQQIQSAFCLEGDGIDWHDPGKGTWHNKHPETACNLCENTRRSTGPLSPFFHFATLQHGACNQLTRLESNQCTGWSICRGKTLHWLSLKWKFWSHRCESNFSHLFASLQISVMLQLCHNWRIIIRQKDPEGSLKNIGKNTASVQEIARLGCWSCQTSRSISGVCAPGTLVQPGTGRAPSPRNEFAMIFQEPTKASILTVQTQTMQVLCYPLKDPWMIVLTWWFWVWPFRSSFFSFSEPKFAQILTNMYKNAAESKYSGLKLRFFCWAQNGPIGGCAQLAKNMGWPAACWSMQCKEKALLVLWQGP